MCILYYFSPIPLNKFLYSVDCQHRHYKEHNKICPPRIKGVIAPPIDKARTSIRYQVDDDSPINECVLVHTTHNEKNLNGEGFEFTGVYTHVHDSLLVLDRERTKRLAKTTRLGANTSLCQPFRFKQLGESKQHRLVKEENQGGHLSWFIFDEFDEKMYLSDSNEIPRIRDKAHWTDPVALHTWNQTKVYSEWNIRKVGKHDKDSRIGGINLAITPLRTINEMLNMDMSLDHPRPLLKALDYKAWNKDFVLHVDPRTSVLPLSFVDQFMGVYEPSGVDSNGYPVWKKNHDLTTELVVSMDYISSTYLSEQGFRSSRSQRESPFEICVRKDNDAIHSTLSLNASGGGDTLLQTSRIPNNLSVLLSDTSSFSEDGPDDSFVSWEISYYGRMVQIHVGFTRKDSFDVAIGKIQQQYKLDWVHSVVRHLAQMIGADCSTIPQPSTKIAEVDKWSAEVTLQSLFDTKNATSWDILDEKTSSLILKKIIGSPNTSEWIKKHKILLFSALIRMKRYVDMNVILDRCLDVSLLGYLFAAESNKRSTNVRDNAPWSEMSDDKLAHIIIYSLSNWKCCEWLDRNEEQLFSSFVSSRKLHSLEVLLTHDKVKVRQTGKSLEFLFGVRNESNAPWFELTEDCSGGILRNAGTSVNTALRAEWFKANKIPLLTVFIKGKRYKDMQVLLADTADNATLRFLFGIESKSCPVWTESSPPWTVLPTKVSKSILLSFENKQGPSYWIKSNSSTLFELLYNGGRYDDLSILVRIGITLSSKQVISMLSTSMPQPTMHAIIDTVFIQEMCKIHIESEEDDDHIVDGLSESDAIDEKTKSVIAIKIKGVKAIRLFSELASYVDLSEVSKSDVFMFRVEEERTERRAMLETLNELFGGNAEYSPWALVDESISSPILEASLSSPDFIKWLDESNASQVLAVLCTRKIRHEEVKMLLGAGVTVTAKAASILFSGLEKGKGHQYNNVIAKLLCSKCTIRFQSKNDYKLMTSVISNTLGKNPKKEMTNMLKKASAELQKPKRQSPKKNVHDNNLDVTTKAPVEEDISKVSKPSTTSAQINFEDAAKKIETALQWYTHELEKLTCEVSLSKRNIEYDRCDQLDMLQVQGEEISTEVAVAKSSSRDIKLTSSVQIANALDNCKSEDEMADIEASIDLLRWDSNSEWVVDITEHAHKWISRHIKRDRALVEQVFRRLALLSTGRWPYSLQKRLKTRARNKSTNLYETKLVSNESFEDCFNMPPSSINFLFSPIEFGEPDYLGGSHRFFTQEV